jgi:2-methylcitrate dehydratase
MNLISERIANFATQLKYEDLSTDIIKNAKRVLLDTLGVAIVASANPSCQIVKKYVEDIGGKPEATIIGGKTRIPCHNAALANGTMVRYFDWNDTLWRSPPSYRLNFHKVPQTGHPSETIPTILAVGEREQATGKEILTSIVLSYQLLREYSLSMPYNYKEPKGWHQSFFYALTGAVSTGKLLGLTVEQLVNAIAIAVLSHGPGLGLVDAADEVYTDVKNIVCSLAEREGILAAFLAQKGMTGNKKVFEHPRGLQLLARAVRGKINLARLVDLSGTIKKDGWHITEVNLKYFPAESSAQGLILALTKIIRENNLKASNVQSVNIKCFKRCRDHLFDEAKRYPINKVTADHSAPFMIAATLVDETLGPAQFHEEKLRDPRIRALIDKITVEYDPSLDGQKEAVVEVTTVDGMKHIERDYWRIMTDMELESKIRTCTDRILTEGQTGKLIDTVYNLEKLEDVRQLMDLTTITL